MIKKNLKLLAILLIVLTVISSFSLCFAEETNETVSESAVEADTQEETSENVYEGDMYLFDSDITMDQLVDGNVYIMGNHITISGQINGNLFVFGDSINFENCYVRYSIYACANNIYYNGACNDLYVASHHLEMTYDSYVVRDVKSIADTTILKAAIGRDADLITNSVDFGSDQEVPIIYGNLRYSANQEKTLADGIVEGEISYNANNNIITKNVSNIVLSFLTIIITTLIIYAIISKVKPNDISQLSSNHSLIYLLKCLGVGVLSVIVGGIITLILLATHIGVQLSFIVAFVFILIGLFATPITTIYITNLLKPILKIEKTYLYYIVLALVSIILYGLTFIPFFVGGILSMIIFFFGYGLIVYNILPHQELSEEELQAKLARKQEKATAKAEKRAEKAKLKEAKKSEKKQN